MTRLAVILRNGQETIYTVRIFTFYFLAWQGCEPELVIHFPEGGQKNIPLADIAFVFVVE